MEDNGRIVREVLEQHGHLAVDVGSLSDDANLYHAGLTSQASVSVMLAIEDAIDVEFPERLLKRATFESIAALVSAIEEMQS